MVSEINSRKKQNFATFVFLFFIDNENRFDQKPLRCKRFLPLAVCSTRSFNGVTDLFEDLFVFKLSTTELLLSKMLVVVFNGAFCATGISVETGFFPFVSLLFARQRVSFKLKLISKFSMFAFIFSRRSTSFFFFMSIEKKILTKFQKLLLFFFDANKSNFTLFDYLHVGKRNSNDKNSSRFSSFVHKMFVLINSQVVFKRDKYFFGRFLLDKKEERNRLKLFHFDESSTKSVVLFISSMNEDKE